MTGITAETPAGEVWEKAFGAYEGCATQSFGDDDQAATAIIQQAFDAREAAKDATIAELGAEVGRLREDEWRPINTAPIDTPIRVKVGEMTFLARLLPDASMTSDERSCDQWQAEREGEHPPCWSGGACWESNEDEVMSLQPTQWRAALNGGSHDQ